MNKRRQFIIATLLVTASYYLVQIAPFAWKYWATLAMVLFAWLYLLVLFFRLTRKWSESLLATFLPVCFLVGVSLFYFLFSQSLIWELILLLVVALGFYTLCLIENVFLVSVQFKVVPLYRAASTVCFLLTLMSAFFLFNAVLSFRLPGWLNGLATFVISSLLLSHLFWTVDLSLPSVESSNSTIVATLSLIMAETALAISFWPVGVSKGSLYLVSLLYVFTGLAQSYRRQRLFKKTIWEFIGVGIGIFLALLLVTNWSGDF